MLAIEQEKPHDNGHDESTLDPASVLAPSPWTVDGLLHAAVNAGEDREVSG